MGTQEKSKARSQEAINASSRKGLVWVTRLHPYGQGWGAWRTPAAALEGPSATCPLHHPPPRTALRPSVNNLHPQDSYGKARPLPPPQMSERGAASPGDDSSCRVGGARDPQLSRCAWQLLRVKHTGGGGDPKNAVNNFETVPARADPQRAPFPGADSPLFWVGPLWSILSGPRPLLPVSH